MEFTLNGKSYLATRYKLREWLKLDAIREKLVDAIETKDLEGLSKSLCSFVSVASNVSMEEVETLPWFEIANAFLLTEDENKLHFEFAVLRGNKEKVDVPAWEYTGRSWYWWNNLLSSKYGWSVEYIAQLDMDDAMGLLQEVLIDDQLQKEWQWSITELAYPYNENTKKSKFQPLDRPRWMMTTIPENVPKIPVMKIRRDMFPVGIVVRGKKNETPTN